jgi:hypothetical protein
VRDFLRLLIKLFALYFLILTLFSIPTYITLLFHTSIGDDYSSLTFDIVGLTFLLAAIFGLFFYLCFNPDKIIDLLKLDRGFASTNIEFGKMQSQTVLKLGISIIGLLLFCRNISILMTHGYRIFKRAVTVSEDYMGGGDDEILSAAIAFINMLVAFVLITNMDGLSKFLIPSKEDNPQPE